MDRCERAQMEYSALLDGQVDAAELADAVLHGLDCARCNASFKSFARLQHALPAPFPARRQRPHRLPLPDLRGLAAAALVLLALGAGWLGSRAEHPALSERAVAISLGAHPERVDEARFVELAVELLQADPRYARSMRELLDRVVPRDAEFTHEGGASDASLLGPISDARTARGNLYY